MLATRDIEQQIIPDTSNPVDDILFIIINCGVGLSGSPYSDPPYSVYSGNSQFVGECTLH